MTTFGTLTPGGEVINKMEFDLGTLPSSDPLAFAYGIKAGQDAARAMNADRDYKIDHGSKHSELAQEYLRGFLFGYRQILVPEGTKILKGQEQKLTLIRLNTYKPQ